MRVLCSPQERWKMRCTPYRRDEVPNALGIRNSVHVSPGACISNENDKVPISMYFALPFFNFVFLPFSIQRLWPFFDALYLLTEMGNNENCMQPTSEKNY